MLRLREHIAQSSSDRRGEILRQVTDLFVANCAEYSEGQVALFDDVIVQLVTAIEKEARILLARRLAPVRNAPPGIMRQLACDDAIEVASPVLSQSERLDDPTLVENAKTKSQQHLLAISRRKSLSEAVTDVLVERGDDQVLLSTAANGGARFSNQGFALLVARSDGCDALATCVGARPDIPPHLFLRLLATASSVVRAKLEEESPRASREIHHVVAGIADRIRAQVLASANDYGDAQALVQSLWRAGRLDATQVAAFAAAGQFAETVAALALMCDLPIEVTDRAMRDERPETLLIFVKAIGLSWPAVKAVLMLRARENGQAADSLEHCLAVFERLKRPTAQNILRFHRRRSGRR
jgi:uncharacterized protein (DUF2336 family)